jgi:hypothetical protein
MLRRLGLALIICLLTPAIAAAADLSITAFAGKWQGNAISQSNISLNFQLTNRDIDVTIRPSGSGFDITWNTVQRQRGNPDKPKEQLKSTKLSFKPVRPGVWAAVGNADPVTSGQAYVWAHISEQTLVISSLQINAEGRHEMQIYRRRLVGVGMELEFSRNVEGEEVRTAKGLLVKVGE